MADPTEILQLVDQVLPAVQGAIDSPCPDDTAVYQQAQAERDKHALAEAQLLFQRAKAGERVVLDPYQLDLLHYPSFEGMNVAFNSNHWVGFNGARCLACNAFSLQMLPVEPLMLNVFMAFEENLPERDAMESFIGHPDTARVLKLPFHRGDLKLRRGDILFVAQVMGGRLPEGCTELPAGISLQWFAITIA